MCLNYDKAWFAEQGVPVPTSLADLVNPAYEDRLVVENPATSSPGLAFLLASIEAFGEDGWEAWWSDLRANGVQVTDGWEEAYNTAFSGGGASEGSRPLVVSYASSPPAEVLYADPPITESPVGVIDASCYRQVEGAGILTGAENEAGARLLIDFLLGEEVQADVPLSMFVFPVRADVELPELFVEHAAHARGRVRDARGGHRRAPRGVDRPVDRSRAPLIRRRSAAAPAGRAGGLPGRVLPVARAQHRRRGAAGRRGVGPVRGR